jgi:hypothetical protein
MQNITQKARFRLIGELRYRVSVTAARGPIAKVFMDHFVGWKVDVVEPELSGSAWTVTVERHVEGKLTPLPDSTCDELAIAMAEARVRVTGYAKPEEILAPRSMPTATRHVGLFRGIPQIAPDP